MSKPPAAGIFFRPHHPPFVHPQAQKGVGGWGCIKIRPCKLAGVGGNPSAFTESPSAGFNKLALVLDKLFLSREHVDCAQSATWLD